VSSMDETTFVEEATRFLVELRGPERGTVDPDLNLVTDSGLDSLQLVALLRFIEELRHRELADVPHLGDLTLRSAYQLLYVGAPAPG
jgi:acyl carrier protein